MYRANAQSRALEEGALVHAGLPYQLVGGTRFYERREVKDAIAYLQAIVNPADNVNMRRILNVPKRGLGARAESIIVSYADAHATTFWDGIDHLDQIDGVPTRTGKQLAAFRDLMRSLSAFARNMTASRPKWWGGALAVRSARRTAAFRGSAGCLRVENLSQLQSVAAEFEQNTPDATLAGFLETTALVADSDQLPSEGEDSGKVTLMTLHTAKGLEYPSCSSPAWSRARSRTRGRWRTPTSFPRSVVWHMWASRVPSVVCTSPVPPCARSGGQANEMMPSQFLDEIPDRLIDWKRRETGMEGMRSGWSRRGFDDEFGGWDDDDFGGTTYGRSSSYGGSSSYGSRGHSSYGGSSSFGSGSRGGSGSSYGGPGDSAHLRATAVPAVRAPDSSTGRAAGSAHPRDCRVAARSRRAAPLPSHLSRRPDRPRRSARTTTSTSPTSMPVTRSRMTSTGWAPSSTRRTRAATP